MAAWQVRGTCALAAVLMVMATACEEPATTSRFKAKPKSVAATPTKSPPPAGNTKPATGGLKGGIADDGGGTATPKPTPTASASATVSPSPTPTASASASAAPTPTPSPSAS